MSRTSEGIGYLEGTTSRAAAESMHATAPRLRERVYRAIAEAGAHGLTVDEVERLLGLTHQTASARVNELMNAQRIDNRNRARRPTRSRRAAKVWTALPRGPGQLGLFGG